MARPAIALWCTFLACTLVNASLIERESLLRREPEAARGSTVASSDPNPLLKRALDADSLAAVTAHHPDDTSTAVTAGDHGHDPDDWHAPRRRRLTDQAHPEEPLFSDGPAPRRRRSRRRRLHLEKLREKDNKRHDCEMRALQEVDEIDVRDRKEAKKEREFDKELQDKQEHEYTKAAALKQAESARDVIEDKEKDGADMAQYKKTIDKMLERRDVSKQRLKDLEDHKQQTASSLEKRNTMHTTNSMPIRASLDEEEVRTEADK